MRVVRGGSAVSAFRINKLLERLRGRLPGCTGLSADFLFYLDLAAELQPQHADKAAALLNLDSLYDPLATGPGLVAVPRIGTISPWSSKATDIFTLCGVAPVKRIERGIHWQITMSSGESAIYAADLTAAVEGILFDPMTESLLDSPEDGGVLFTEAQPQPLVTVDLLKGGAEALSAANEEFGFALSKEEQAYLIERFRELGRNPTDVELMMFAQVNSEHCRHKIFNADWNIDGEDRDISLFAMIRTTHQHSSAGTLSAYSDNAAVLEGSDASRLAPDADSGIYAYTREPVHFTAKVETHNHPTAISPFPGASTGSGGEIRDEGATGRGGKPKAGLVGYSVSHLSLPDLPRPWETAAQRPARIASALQIMLEGPIGAAAFNNEFGRPNIAGYFRNFEHREDNQKTWHGYHKPIMLAGGLGSIRPGHVDKQVIAPGMPIIVLGGPTMLIGLGGGAASSVASGSSSESLDFASVQRGNPEMQRRCQEVIDACCALGDDNPIVSIHDVGAGGLCNALPELVHDAGAGGNFELRNVLNDEPGMSPMQIWCNESQERYVLAVRPESLPEFEKLCRRERCLYAVVGEATDDGRLLLTDRHFPVSSKEGIHPIELPMDVLFGLPPKMYRQVESIDRQSGNPPAQAEDVDEALDRVLAFPAVGDKTFLVTIGDRSVTGLIARDQMVGPWQVPVADVAVTAAGYTSNSGEAFAIGERTPLAVLDAPASGRMAIGEALTNLCAAHIPDLSRVRLSANWMVAAGEPGHDADLYATVQSITRDMCRALGVSIPVGKDSMSMKTVWNENGEEHRVVSPLSLVVSAFTAVGDITRTLTPQLDTDGETELWLLDLGFGKNRMGGSIYQQSGGSLQGEPADVVDVGALGCFIQLVQDLNSMGILKAYHDRSDGGLITTLYEMAFASRCGLEIELDDLAGRPLDMLFNEELGAVVQVDRADRDALVGAAGEAGLGEILHCIGRPVAGSRVRVEHNGNTVSERERADCHRNYSSTTWQMQRMRDNPDCADQEYDRILDDADTGLFCELGFDLKQEEAVILEAPSLGLSSPRVAILREQGVNGQLEMAAAFSAVGFEAVDVTTTDLVDGLTLDGFAGLAACGGFSFGDVLGAGEGWAKSILFNNELRDRFQAFFERRDTFALGVCNGCQMMSAIKPIIPGTDHWPRFLRNTSEQYEARFVMVEVQQTRSVLFADMEGSRFPVSTAHGEGRAVMASDSSLANLQSGGQVCLRYIDNQGQPTEQYPLNPNGSVQGVTGFTNDDGRVTIMMPHPERVFRTVSNSWHPGDWGEYSPWIKIFHNARRWAG